MSTYSEDEFDTLPNVYDGIDFDNIPELCASSGSDAYDRGKRTPERDLDLFDNFSDTLEDVDWEKIENLSSAACSSTLGTYHSDGVTSTAVVTADEHSDKNSIGPPQIGKHKSSSPSPYSFERLDDCTLAEVDTSRVRFFQAELKEEPRDIPLQSIYTAGPSYTGLNGPVPSGSQIRESKASVNLINVMETTTPSVIGTKGATVPWRPTSSSCSSDLAASQSTSPSAPTSILAATSVVITKKRDRSSSQSPRKQARLSGQTAPDPYKRAPSRSPKGKGKAKDDMMSRDGLRSLLEGYEDEMTCPICCDIFVYPHLNNPCGHSVCGNCGADWISRQPKKKPTCPVCRAKLIPSAPMIPNYSMDNAVMRHIQALGENRVEGWGPGGAKLAEWNLRKELRKSKGGWEEMREARRKRCKRSQE